MKWSKQGAGTAVLAVALAAASGTALARGHVDFGVFIGPPVVGYGYGYGYPYPYGYPYAYGYPAYYPPAVVEVPPAPPVNYVQKDDADSGAGDWYYCPKSGAYYPHVKTCPSGWQRVPPRPAQ